MNYADIKKCDVANGPGIRVSVFVSGCTHRCKNCFNQEAWDFHYGKPFTKDTVDDILNLVNKPFYHGLTFLGGEPFEYTNQQGLLPLAKAFKERFPEKTLWCFTGYLFDEEIMGQMYDKWPETRELLSYIDVLVDGRFVEELKDLNLRFKGSSNQRTIMVQESITSGAIVLWEPPEYDY